MGDDERKQSAAEAAAKKQQVAEERKQAAAEAAAKKQQLAEERKQLAEQKRQEAQQRKLDSTETQQKKQQAVKAVSKASRGGTISLFGFGGGKPDSGDSPTVSAKSAPNAPRGVPVISKWKQARDGSITGVISGSRDFEDGAPVTTSPIKGSGAGGTVVTTKSGSRYFLEGGKAAAAPSKASNKAKAAANARGEAAAAAKQLAAEKAEKAKQQKEAALAAKKLAADKAKQEREAKAAAAAAAKVEKAAAAAAAKAEAAAAQKARKTGNKQEAPKKVIQAKRSPTISLFGGGGNTPTISLFGGGGGSDKQSSQPVPARAPPAKKQQKQPKLAPRGVPTISNWKLNGDGSVSGKISGSPNFRDGEKVTTSQIVQGRIEAGAVVQTGSGSKYFLG